MLDLVILSWYGLSIQIFYINQNEKPEVYNIQLKRGSEEDINMSTEAEKGKKDLFKS